MVCFFIFSFFACKLLHAGKFVVFFSVEATRRRKETSNSSLKISTSIIRPSVRPVPAPLRPPWSQVNTRAEKEKKCFKNSSWVFLLSLPCLLACLENSKSIYFVLAAFWLAGWLAVVSVCLVVSPTKWCRHRLQNFYEWITIIHANILCLLCCVGRVCLLFLFQKTNQI